MARSWVRCTKPLRRVLAARALRQAAGERRRTRWPVIAEALAAAGPGHVFLAGDSHAELLGTPDLGWPVVNGGIGGIDAATYAHDLRGLDRRLRAAVAVLLIGSNDTHLARRPASARCRLAFGATVADLIGQLQDRAEAVVVTAIPPVCQPVAGYRHLPAMTLYSATLAAVSAKRGCVFVDPFAELRGPDPALAAPGVGMDPLGAHLADYGAVARALRSVIVRRSRRAEAG